MEEKELKKQNPKDEEIQKYLEETIYLINDMKENEDKNRVTQKVNEIFEKEEIKKITKEIEDIQIEKI
jgi:5-bromo-4-chloroindolyl phosphate hydrolysis protein